MCFSVDVEVSVYYNTVSIRQIAYKDIRKLYNTTEKRKEKMVQILPDFKIIILLFYKDNNKQISKQINVYKKYGQNFSFVVQTSEFKIYFYLIRSI